MPQNKRFDPYNRNDKKDISEKLSDIDNAGGIPNGGNSIPTTRYDIMILRALRRIMRATDMHSRKLRATHHITAPQLVCLIAVIEDGPLTIGAIAERVFLSPSTVVGILDRLESKGLIMRLRDAKDRRVVNVSATPAGVILKENAPSPLQEGLAAALTDLPEIEQATIALSLQRIVDLMEARSIEAAPILETGQLVSSDPGDEDISEENSFMDSNDNEGVE